MAAAYDESGKMIGFTSVEGSRQSISFTCSGEVYNVKLFLSGGDLMPESDYAYTAVIS
jgi:hypothetical protein